jgi:hypothetical protein
MALVVLGKQVESIVVRKVLKLPNIHIFQNSDLKYCCLLTLEMVKRSAYTTTSNLTYLDQNLLAIVLLNSGHELLKKLMVFLFHMKTSDSRLYQIERYCTLRRAAS